jgi:hypothetical protein
VAKCIGYGDLITASHSGFQIERNDFYGAAGSFRDDLALIHPCPGSKRAQKVQKRLLVRSRSHIEIVDHGIRFGTVAGMILNSAQQVCLATVMQEEEALSHAP